MQASKRQGSEHRSHSLYYSHNSQPIQDIESYCQPQNIYSDDVSNGGSFTVHTSQGPYCTLESSSATGSYNVHNSSSSHSFSSSGSPQSQQDSQSYPSDQHYSPDVNYGSPVSGSCLTEDVHGLQHKLRELETVMLGPDSDIVDSFEGASPANGAIAEALKDEDRVHIIDFQIAQGSQWITLIQALSARPGGQRLARLADSSNVPFEFNAAAMSGCEVELEHLRVRPGEALAVNFPFQLHHMPDESVSTQNHRDRLLRLVKSLSPKVVTLVEQESNTNTAPFFPRFVETLSYYSAIFESIDVTLPRENKERISVEQHCLARDIGTSRSFTGDWWL
ncbi:hypothetical protein H6P81_014807 [Aristolochia fimbriata]|uniref:Uncharacterized protein n=1 Tax=Aristolochia fimbriata TaxID=158543 RepID=A0AAV7E3Q7_ARIFI|nr:hypothetical protein H6P81_014807 [Aristolochia fimbriata]